MRTLDFQILNVFAETRFSGNPLAVVEDARALTEDELLMVCRQFNLAETTFVYPPAQGGAARVRIFSPEGELRFAGHPTLGTAHVVRALLGAGDEFALELPVGPIPVTAEGDRWELRANSGTTRDAPSIGDLAVLTGLETDAILPGARWVSTGSEQLLVPILDTARLARAQPEFAGLSRFGTNAAGRPNVSLFVLEEDRVTSRYFWAQGREVREDPGTGSACANLGAWLLERGETGPRSWTIEQGHQTGRVNHLRLRLDAAQRIHVAGRVIPLMRGQLSLD